MIHVCQMAQLVDDYIVENGRGSQHEPPVEGESSLCAAASPAGLLVADSNAVVGTAGKLAEVCGSFRKIFFGGSDVSLSQRGTLRICKVGYRPVSLPFEGLQIFGDDPVLLFNEKAVKFPLGGALRDTYCDPALGRNADGTAFAVAADECVGKFIQFALIFDI